MKNFLISFFALFFVFQICIAVIEDDKEELGFWNKVSQLPENQKRIKRCYCGGYGSYGGGYGGYGGYPSYGGGYGGYPSYGGGFGGGMPYGFGSPFGGFYG
uniref:Glycine-rich protein n=1 Tax=Panagrolaimus davidi TaxID=227884 RepID=A0A914QNU4_9BILA